MLKRFIQRRSQKAGLPPGSLVYVGEKKAEEPLIIIFDYNEAEFHEIETETAEDTYPFREAQTVSWINVSRINDVNTVEKIGSHFHIHPLILEDILTQGQRPKLEDMDDYLFIILNMLSIDNSNGGIKAEQVSLALGENYLITFQEIEGDVFDTIRDRIRNAKGRIRKLGTDYLAYSLIDAIVDNYFIILEKLGERIEDLEEQLIENPGTQMLHGIHDMKRELLFLRKSVWPLREVISGLEKSESPLIRDSTVMYLRDLYDHTIQVIDAVETFRDMLAGILDIYLSSISNRLNAVMKVLTIISTIFIPLTFIAGVYGMNFANMPELHSRWGYPVVVSVMTVIALTMVGIFKKKKWF
jgi:magnesium transporter